MRVQSHEFERWQFLLENPPMTRPDWLPPPEDVPELGHLRAEHLRLLALLDEQEEAYLGVVARRDTEIEARRAAQESSFLGRSKGKPPELTVTEADLAEAKAKADAARDALQTFAEAAVEEIKELVPELLVGLDEIVKQANEKRAEAQALEEEAGLLEGGTRRLRNWLARIDGRSVLGHIAWTDLVGSAPPKPMTVAELYSEARPAYGVAELEGPDTDSGSAAFGTDDPNNLDSDDDETRTWEVALDGDPK